jgi:hypothetical protein
MRTLFGEERFFEKVVRVFVGHHRDDCFREKSPGSGPRKPENNNGGTQRLPGAIPGSDFKAMFWPAGILNAPENQPS